MRRGLADGASAVRPYGETAFLVDLPGLDAVRTLHRELVADAPDDVLDVVPAARTVLVTYARSHGAAAVRAWLDAALDRARRTTGPADDAPARRGAPVEIPVVYDGADLADVAAWAGVSVDEVVARHTGRTYEAAFGGFAPGFAYLTGVDPVIAAPRLATPRTRVPAGAVALAADLTAVYPSASPGGWRLLGSTDRQMFDVDRDPPALVAPGDLVRFRTVRGTARGGAAPAVDGRSAARGVGEARTHGVGETQGRDGRALTVLSPGPLTLVEDEGRPGWAAIGVGRSGAADRGSAALANRVVGNSPDAALLEVTFGGLVLRADARRSSRSREPSCPRRSTACPSGRALRCGSREVPCSGSERPSTVCAPTSRCAGACSSSRCSARARTTSCPRWGLARCAPATCSARDLRRPRGPSTTRLRCGSRRELDDRGSGTRRCCVRSRARARTGSPRSPGAHSRSRGRSARRATASRCGWTARPCRGRRASCPPRGSCAGRSRCRPTGDRSCSSPTIRSPAGTRSSPSCRRTTSTGRRS
ncbi:hypothetical protein BJF88_05985 [Cellulosimicrobium sp. CUA-896]|nr:hypothetical protein BJF88_05985 [Cellulosimicrobium sp. CUA-896]